MSINIMVTAFLFSSFVVLPVLSIESGASAIIVNDQSVPLEEFLLVAARKKALVYDHFYKKYGVQPNRAFWNSSYGDETPFKLLKDMVVKDLVQIKIIQQLALNYGLVNDISYSSFLDRMKKENRRREVAVKRGEVIYGPIQYSREVYYDYVNSNLSIDLCRTYMRAGKTRNEYDGWIWEKTERAAVVVNEKVIRDYISRNKF